MAWPCREAEAVIMCARKSLSEAECATLRGLLGANDFRWGYFVEKVQSHRLEGLAYLHLSSHANELTPEDVLVQLRAATMLIRMRGQWYINELAQVLDTFNNAGIKAAILKGAYLAPAVYADLRLRCFADLDLLVRSSDYSDIHSLLVSSGYSQVELVDGRPVAATDAVLERYSLSLQHYTEYLKGRKGTVLPWYKCDVHTRFTTSYDNITYDAQEAMNRIMETSIKGVRAYILAPVDQLIHLCLHLYSHTRAIKDIEHLNDLVLIRFVDIYEILLLEHTDWDVFLTAALSDEGLFQALGYVMNLLERIYGRILPSAIHDAFQTDGLMRHVDSISDRWTQDDNSVIGYWTTPFESRLFDESRPNEAYRLFYGHTLRELDRQRGHQR